MPPVYNAFTATQRGLVPASGGGTANFLRADGSWAAPPSGSPGGSTGQLQWNNAGAFAGMGSSSVSTSGNLLTITAGTATDTPLSLQPAASQSVSLLVTGSNIFFAKPAVQLLGADNGSSNGGGGLELGDGGGVKFLLYRTIQNAFALKTDSPLDIIGGGLHIGPHVGASSTLVVTTNYSVGQTGYPTMILQSASGQNQDMLQCRQSDGSTIFASIDMYGKASFGALLLGPPTASTVAQTIKLAVSQSADALQVLASDGTTKLMGVDCAGRLISSAGNESTGSGVATLGINYPGISSTPYTWISMKTSDGSTVYVPVWK